ncbi:MAG TPA: hypothetical protein VLG28_08600 [Acidimicrobiia bacterium]|jgi:hypothetical protein|nr:hypothetical protein [Acidimicrobiia bacterium]
MTDQGIGGRTEAHADRGLRGAVVGYHGYPQLTVTALAPSASDELVVSIILSFGDSATPRAPWLEITVAPAPTDPPARHSLLLRSYRSLQIDMTPMGASRLIGVSADQLESDDLDTTAVLGSELYRLLSRLASAPTWAIRFAAVDDYLMERLKGARPRSLAAGAAWRKFAESTGMVLIGELAPFTEPDEELPSPGGPYDVHTAAADRIRRRYHHTGAPTTAEAPERTI